ncbi:MAG: hypothetical protein COW18_05135 [Zetaproteobacteria bacterium CG12_big_fil_rev_8_21_14_0_65_54_13]
MSSVIDFTVLLLIGGICWRAYRYRQAWFCMIPYLLWQQCRNRSLVRQLLVFGPVVVGWLLLCHWLNAHAWPATAAGFMLFAMTVGLESMRSAEERQKMEDIL